MDALPGLVVVSGPPGSGKTTLAHALARGIGCPAVCRDEIKEGMARTAPAPVPGPRDELALRTLRTFFEVLGLLLAAGVTTVAEAAFQDRLWRPGLLPLQGLARIRIVHCTASADIALARRVRRMRDEPTRRAHDTAPLDDVDGERRRHEAFDPVALDVPSLRVDTTDGYDPGFPAVLAFAAAAAATAR